MISLMRQTPVMTVLIWDTYRLITFWGYQILYVNSLTWTKMILFGFRLIPRNFSKWGRFLLYPNCFLNCVPSPSQRPRRNKGCRMEVKTLTTDMIMCCRGLEFWIKNSELLAYLKISKSVLSAWSKLLYLHNSVSSTLFVLKLHGFLGIWPIPFSWKLWPISAVTYSIQKLFHTVGISLPPIALWQPA